MITEVGLESVRRDDRSAVTMGMFDGVHRGHRVILSRLREVANETAGPATVITFDPHPQAVLRGGPVPLLSTVAERRDLLTQIGIDRMIILSFTPDLAGMSARQFVEEVLVRRVGLRAFVLGHDHGFGRDREGSEETLARMGHDLGFTAHTVGPELVGSDVVSSSRIRRLLTDEGAVEAASDLLGRPYDLDGEVVHGDSRGRTIGFPTANIVPLHPDKVIPLRGVYAVEVVRMKTGARLGGMMNIGTRPTFSDGTLTHLEVNLFDFSDELYGETLRIRFLERIRDEMRFDSAEALIAQLRRDQERCRRVKPNL